MESCRRLLLSGLEFLRIHLSEDQVEQLLHFIRLIEKWNKAYNLTSIRKLDDMVGLHLLDSLAVLPYIAGDRVVDIGTGAGLPGIPLAISRPETAFTLLDSNAKKTRFVQQAVIELKLKNIEVHLGRVENHHPIRPYDTAITRAFSSLPEMVRLTRHLLGKDGVLLAMKGQEPYDELAQLATETTLIPIKIPGIEAERCLVKIRSQAITGEMAWEK
ncbi:MAG: 16S rRNA (guanine(527)-N(7))-methyltransferase RsmG [Gammaproteobacteria bacterium]